MSWSAPTSMRPSVVLGFADILFNEGEYSGSSGVYMDDMTAHATTLDETAVLVEAVKGDRQAFGDLVRAYQKRAYTIAYSFVGNREDALEMAQESFARAFKAMPRFDTQYPFYPWLYRIIKNTCLNHLKKKKRHGEVSLDGMMVTGFDVRDMGPSPRGEARREELRRSLRAAMDALSPEHREILIMRHFQELSYKEIAACLEIPQGTVMSRLHAARKSLRGALDCGTAQDTSQEAQSN